MVPFFFGPREHHAVATPAEYAARHAEFIRGKAVRGSRVTVHESPAPVTARIDCGSWLIDCECGAGNAVDPDWPAAHCFGCGAVHRNVTFPPPELRVGIEVALLERQLPRARSWTPGETVAHLNRETAHLKIGRDPNRQTGRAITFTEGQPPVVHDGGDA
jgi:hypothetical protein